MSVHNLNQTFADFSLTDKTLKWLSLQNKDSKNIFSFTVVHLIGSAFLLGAGISDTLIQTAAAVVTLVTGVFATPFDCVLSLAGKPPLLKAWSWKMTIDHAAHAIKHALCTLIISVENFFVGPERAREDFFKDSIEMERGVIAKEKLQEAVNEKVQAEAQAKKAQEETLAKKIQEEAQAKKVQAEAQAKKAQEEAQAKKAQEEAQAKKAQAEAQAKKVQAEAAQAKKAQAEAQAKKVQAEAQAKKAQAEAQAKKVQAEAQAKKAQAEAPSQTLSTPRKHRPAMLTPTLATLERPTVPPFLPKNSLLPPIAPPPQKEPTLPVTPTLNPPTERPAESSVGEPGIDASELKKGFSRLKKVDLGAVEKERAKRRNELPTELVSAAVAADKYKGEKYQSASPSLFGGDVIHDDEWNNSP